MTTSLHSKFLGPLGNGSTGHSDSESNDESQRETAAVSTNLTSWERAPTNLTPRDRAPTNLTPRERAKSIFSELDLHASGSLTRAEFIDAYVNR